MTDLLENLQRQIQELISFAQHHQNRPLLYDALAVNSKKLILALESVDSYFGIWAQYPTQNFTEAQIELMRQENGERITDVLKSLFIFTVSNIEFETRKIINTTDIPELLEAVNRKEKLLDEFDAVFDELEKKCQDPLRKFRKKLKDTPPFDSFSKIITNSNKFGIISDEDTKIWDFIIAVRNTVIHNNAIGSIDKEVEFDGQNFAIAKDQMMQGTLSFFLTLTAKINQLFASWLLNITPEPNVS